MERGAITAREGQHVRANYGSKLSMIDHWFGEVLDAIDEKDLWDDTVVILCTDHGHYLGEKDIWGKPGVPHYEQMGHTPLYISCPGVEPGRVDALTTNVDINATLCEIFGVVPAHQTHGVSMLPLLHGTKRSIREWSLSGTYGGWVHVYDGQRKYARSATADTFPLSMWSNRWSTMLYARAEEFWPLPDARARLDYMPGSTVPVIRQPFEKGDIRPWWAGVPPIDQHYLFDVSTDPDENENRLGGTDEKDMIELLRVALKGVEAPDEHFQRMGLV